MVESDGFPAGGSGGDRSRRSPREGAVSCGHERVELRRERHPSKPTMTTPSPVPRWKTIFSAVALGALAGGLLSVVRTCYVLVLERVLRSVGELELVRWQLFGKLEREFAAHVIIGAVTGLWIWSWLRRFRGSWLIGLLGGLAGMALVMAGDLGGSDSQRILHLANSDRDSSRWLTISGLILVSGSVLTWAVAVDFRREAAFRFSRPVAVLLIAGVIAIIPTSVGTVMIGHSPTMTTRVVCRELVLEDQDWTVKYHHPKAKPYAGILTPTPDHRADGGELPAIIMPAPCEIQITVTEEDGPVNLRVAAGVDFSNDVKKRKQRADKLLDGAEFKFKFDVARNGKRIFSSSDQSYQTYDKGDYKNHREWMRPGKEADLKFVPGDVITLRTGVNGITPKQLARLDPYVIGFGEVSLERVVERERQLADPETPSIVLIVQDTMRADRSSTYDYEKDTTPALTELAQRGISYTNARSASSWTWPSTASILTGLLPDAHGVTDDSSCYLIGRNETLAEVLQERGYTTGAFTCNPLVSIEKNFNQGFEFYSASARKFIKTDQVMSAMKGWLDTNAGSRFFLYVHLVDPHLPYEPREEDVERFVTHKPDDLPDHKMVHNEYKGRALKGGGVDEHGHPVHATFPEGHIEYLSSMYDACVATGDAYLAELLGHLQDLGLGDDTIVAFTSDHGEAWMEHGGLTHGHSLHKELVHVPLVIAGPGLPRGIECETPVSNRHLAATLAAFGGAEMAGVPDAMNLADPDSLEVKPVFFATTHGTWNRRRGRQPLYGVREGKWVLHYAPQGSDFGVDLNDAPVGGQYKLYDIEADPYETVDVSKDNVELAERLKMMILDSLAAQLAQKGRHVEIGAGSATTDLLDAIGYNVGKIVPGEDGDEDGPATDETGSGGAEE